MGSIGDCYDNAVIESFWSRMQVELLDRKRWRTRVELANAIFEYLEIFHNRQRRHSALGMLTPVEFEAVINQRQRHEIQPADSTEPRAPQSLHKTRGGSPCVSSSAQGRFSSCKGSGFTVRLGEWRGGHVSRG